MHVPTEAGDDSRPLGGKKNCDGARQQDRVHPVHADRFYRGSCFAPASPAASSRGAAGGAMIVQGDVIAIGSRGAVRVPFPLRSFSLVCASVVDKTLRGLSDGVRRMQASSVTSHFSTVRANVSSSRIANPESASPTVIAD